MAAPTAPDIDSIAQEGIKKAGYSSPSSTQVTRAQDEWLQEIKNDIWLLGKCLKPLMAEHLEILNGCQSQYSFPSGFDSLLDARLIWADEVNDVTGTAASTVTLDSTDETAGEDDVEGHQIVIYSGTGKGSMSQCISYDTDTYIATVYPAWANAINGTAPAEDDTYFIAVRFADLDIKHISEHDLISLPHTKGPPNELYIVGEDTHYGFYRLYQTPDDDHYYAVHLRYFVNLLTLDLSSDRMTMLYDRWRNLWKQGIMARQLQDDDDDRAVAAMARYFNMVKDTVALETYGRNVRLHYSQIGA